MEKLKTALNKMYKNTNILLEKEFAKAKEDKDFEKLVQKLDAPNKVLMKYTSKLQNTANELKNCSSCKNILQCQNELEGHIYYPEVENDNLIFNYVPCKYQKQVEKENKYKENINLFDMPKEIKNAQMKNIHTDDKNRVKTIKWITNFIENYQKDEKIKGLYLTGNFGSGKTYLLSAMLNELAKKNKKIAIVYFPDFLRTLKSSFNDDETYNAIFNYIRNVEFLLIDDIGAETTTSWSRDEVLGTILQYRMQENLKTFFTSNLSIDQLEENLSIANNKIDKVKARRIIERIKYMCDEITMITEDKRKEC